MTEITLTPALQAIKDTQKKMMELQEQAGKQLASALAEGFQPIFDEHEVLGSVTWTQYTPYFNDGDTCVFSSNISYPSVNTTTDVAEETEGGYEEGGEDFQSRRDPIITIGYEEHSEPYRDFAGRVIGTRPDYSKPITKTNDDYDPAVEAADVAVKEFVKGLTAGDKRDYSSDQPSAMDQALLSAFGDHAMVRVFRGDTGKVVIEVDSYEHD